MTMFIWSLLYFAIWEFRTASLAEEKLSSLLNAIFGPVALFIFYCQWKHTDILINKMGHGSSCASKDKWYDIVHIYRAKLLSSLPMKTASSISPLGSSLPAHNIPELRWSIRECQLGTRQNYAQSEQPQLSTSSSKMDNRMDMETGLTHALALFNLSGDV